MNQISIITVTRNRAELLARRALVSLQQQTIEDFEWIVINDGGDTATRKLIESVKSDLNFELIYREMPHLNEGFALCHGRNLGISLAKNELVTYLDDDNALYPDFVASMTSFMTANPQLKLALPLQKRSRQVWQNGTMVVQGRTFISPASDSNINDLICHRELVDSNGLTHILADAPRWNKSHRIYCDYEYFLQCLSLWGSASFEVNPNLLVEYIQSNQGIIGQSDYGSWAMELKQIVTNHKSYPILFSNPEYKEALELLSDKYEKKHKKKLNIPAFKYTQAANDDL